jgi:hypothetical protein
MTTKPIVLCLIAVAGCSGRAPIDSPAPAPAARPSLRSLRSSAVPQPRENLALLADKTAASADGQVPQLEYLGGPILQSVNVYAVYWGGNVSADTVRAIPDYYRTVLADGPFMQMLSEYDTTSPAQTIGHGTFAGEIVDADAPIPPAGTALTDQRIRAELSRLIDLGRLPAQNERNLFMIYFPPGLNITDPNGQRLCVDLCAYHNAFQRNGDDPTNTGHNVYYGVLPDFANNGCQATPGPQPSFCGFDPDNLTNLEVVSSHELVEAITDSAIGIPAPGPIGSPLAWNDIVFGEIGDVCEFFADGSTNGVNVQKFWSNEDRACRDHRPTSNLLLDASPATQTVKAGGAATFNIRLSPPPTGAVNQDPVTFSLVAKDPVGFVFPGSFKPAAITVGESAIATLPIAADEPSQVKPVLVSGHDSNGLVHYAATTITITTAPPVISEVSPRVGNSVGGTQVTLRGQRLSPQVKVQVGTGGVFVPALVKTTQDPKTHVVTATVTTPGFAIASGQERERVQIVVTNPDGNTASVDFTYVRGCADERPKITIVDTPSGPIAGGTIVGVQGVNFGASARDANGNFVEPTVLFGGQKATIIDMDPKNSNSLVVVTPSVSAATVVDVVLVNANGEASRPFASFAYGPDAPPQLIQKKPLSIDHGSRDGGTYVTLFADVASAPLDANATVTFGGQPATVKTVNDSFAGVIAPPHAPGVVDVVITNADGEQSIAKRAFRYE